MVSRRKMNVKVFGVLLPVLLLSACGTDMHAWTYDTQCSQTQARNILMKDLCNRFGAQARCDESNISPSSARVIIEGKEHSFWNGPSIAYVYLTTRTGPISIFLETEANPKSQELGKSVSDVIGQSLNASGCPWTLKERQYTQAPKLG